MKDRWRIEITAALTGWHLAGVFAEKPPERPALPEWLTVQRSFDDWLVSTPDGAELASTNDDQALSPEQLDIMIAYGWKDVDDD